MYHVCTMYIYICIPWWRGYTPSSCMWTWAQNLGAFTPYHPGILHKFPRNLRGRKSRGGFYPIEGIYPCRYSIYMYIYVPVYVYVYIYIFFCFWSEENSNVVVMHFFNLFSQETLTALKCTNYGISAVPKLVAYPVFYSLLGPYRCASHILHKNQVNHTFHLLPK